MSYFLSPENLNPEKEFTITGEEARHILLSRRMKVGDCIKLQGTDGKRYVSQIIKIGKKDLVVKPLHGITTPSELPVKITLFQSVISEKALDFVFQKATELGAHAITLYNSHNTPAKLSKQVFDRKQDRWNKILWEAAKQSDRGAVPQLLFCESLDEIIIQSSSFNQVIILDASGSKPSTLNAVRSTLALCIGPEGGFTPAELDKLKPIKNSTILSINPFTLRAETAAIAGLALIQNL